MDQVCTKERLAEQVLRILNGGDINYEENLDNRDIQLYIEQAVAILVKRGFLQSKGGEVGEINGSLVLTFPNIVVKEDFMGFFAEIPSCTVGLMEGRGIHEVGDNGGAYIPTMNGWAALSEGLDGVNLEGRIGFYQDNKILRFFNTNNFKDHVVYMKLVAAFDAIDEDVQINIPLDMQAEIINLTIELFAKTPQVDKVSDNVDDEI